MCCAASQKAFKAAETARVLEDAAREKLFLEAEAEVARIAAIEAAEVAKAEAEAKVVADAKARAEAKAAAEAKGRTEAAALARRKATEKAAAEAAAATLKAAQEVASLKAAQEEAAAHVAAEEKAATERAAAEKAMAEAAAGKQRLQQETAARKLKAEQEAAAREAAEAKAAAEARVAALAAAAAQADREKAMAEAKSMAGAMAAAAEAEAARLEKVAAADAEAARYLAAAKSPSKPLVAPVDEDDDEDEEEEEELDDEDLLDQIEAAEGDDNYKLLLRILRKLCSEDGDEVEDAEDVVEGATDALLRLIAASTKAEIGGAGACEVVCMVLHSWIDEPAIVEAALGVVYKLSTGCEANCKLFEEVEDSAGGSEAEDSVSNLIVAAMDLHAEDEATLQEQACLAVAALATGSEALTVALKDAGVVAELGWCKETRITNERNKAYPDRAMTALFAWTKGTTKDQAPAPEPEPEPAPAPSPAKEPSPTELRVGCIVDFPHAAHKPPMCIAHIDRQSSAAVLLGLEDYRAAASKGEGQPKDPYAFLSRRSRLAPLTALRFRGAGAS